MSYCQIISLARCILIRIFVTPSVMGDAYSLCYVEVTFHYVHMRFIVMFNYDYLIVENDDNKNVD
jgi:hypothetical protein